MERLFGGIEAGGTKFICAVGTGPGNLLETTRIDTTGPAETLAKAIDFFRPFKARNRLAAIGIGSFGPVDLRPESPAYGHITTTPKPGWRHVDLVGMVQKSLQIPVGFDTDVNAAVLAEFNWGAAKGCDNSIYLTVGTGIGGGVMVNGKLLHGLAHPEMGHILLPHDLKSDPFPGNCPFHKNCLEGLASGRALAKRWGTEPVKLAGDHPAWQIEAHYLSLALVNFVFSLSPQRIIMGGGIMQQTQLFDMIHRDTIRLLNGYIQADEIIKNIDTFIVPPGLGHRSGILGAIALARAAATA